MKENPNSLTVGNYNTSTAFSGTGTTTASITSRGSTCTTAPYYYDGMYSVPVIEIHTSNHTQLMENSTTQPQQVQVAVFEIKRNDDLEVVTTKYISTFWVEHKPKADLKLTIAKQLAKDVDLDKIVIRELVRIAF